MRLALAVIDSRCVLHDGHIVVVVVHVVVVVVAVVVVVVVIQGWSCACLVVYLSLGWTMSRWQHRSIASSDTSLNCSSGK